MIAFNFSGILTTAHLAMSAPDIAMADRIAAVGVASANHVLARRRATVLPGEPVDARETDVTIGGGE